MSLAVALRPTTIAIQIPIRSATVVILPSTAASLCEADVCIVNGGSAEALPSSRVSVGSAPLPRGTLASVKLKVAPVADSCKPKVPIANTEDGDLVLSAPSDTDRVARGLGHVVVTMYKPLAFRVSADTEKEIIYNTSLFESHGPICRFQGFWPSLPQLHTWISQSWEPISKGSVNIFPLAKGFFIAKFEHAEDRSKILCINPFSWEDKFVLMVKPWFLGFNPSTNSFNEIPIWVRLPNHPLYLWRDSLLEEMGEALGEFLMIDKDSYQIYHSTYARIFINIDVSKGLPVEIEIESF
ncbi:hypothetical protein SUGI_0683830 [Cryptomeria japonica]|nr:hypothetical protein SUGI_0683830 [Cryptomeria japonica]